MSYAPSNMSRGMKKNLPLGVQKMFFLSSSGFNASNLSFRAGQGNMNKFITDCIVCENLRQLLEYQRIRKYAGVAEYSTKKVPCDRVKNSERVKLLKVGAQVHSMAKYLLLFLQSCIIHFGATAHPESPSWCFLHHKMVP